MSGGASVLEALKGAIGNAKIVCEDYHGAGCAACTADAALLRSLREALDGAKFMCDHEEMADAPFRDCRCCSCKLARLLSPAAGPTEKEGSE